MKKYIFILIMTTAIAACKNSEKQKSDAAGEPETEQEATAALPATDLYEKEWKLSELNGKAVVPDSTFKQTPFLVFEKDKISGKGGCNGIGGNLEVKDNGEIKISEIITTLMACPNLETEREFIEVLRNTTHYSIDDNTLTLKDKADGTPTAVLKAEE